MSSMSSSPSRKSVSAYACACACAYAYTCACACACACACMIPISRFIRSISLFISIALLSLVLPPPCCCCLPNLRVGSQELTQHVRDRRHSVAMRYQVGNARPTMLTLTGGLPASARLLLPYGLYTKGYFAAAAALSSLSLCYIDE